MRKETKYMSDCGTFIIEGDYLKAKTNTEGIDNLTALNKFLTEYLEDIKVKNDFGINGAIFVPNATVEPTAPIEPISEAEKLFLELIEGGKWEGDYYLNKEGNKIIYNGEKHVVWLDCYLFWEKFHKQFNMKFEEVQYFIKHQLLKHLKIEGKIPASLPWKRKS